MVLRENSVNIPETEVKPKGVDRNMAVCILNVIYEGLGW